MGKKDHTDVLLCVVGPSPRFLLLFFFKKTLGLSKSHCEVSSESKKHSSSLSLSEQHIGYYVYTVSQFLMCSIYYLRILFLFKDRVKMQTAIECLFNAMYILIFKAKCLILKIKMQKEISFHNY